MDQENQKLQVKKSRLRTWIITASGSRYGAWLLYFIAFIESAFFPIPPDFLMIPMIVAKPSSWKKLALWTTIFSVLGAFLGYLIGAVFFETIGKWIVETYNLQDEMMTVGGFYENNAFLSLVFAGFTPLPFKVFTVAAGIFKINLLTLFIAGVVGRGLRFFVVGYISQIGGSKAFWDYLKNIKKTTFVAFGLLTAFLLYWFLFK